MIFALYNSHVLCSCFVWTSQSYMLDWLSRNYRDNTGR